MGFSNDEIDEPISTINVTPLVDVMLVLLVIFMVTAPMLQQGVEVDLPKASTGPLNQDLEPFVLSIDKKGDVFAGQDTPVSGDNVGAKVKDILAARGMTNEKVYIKADKSLDYGQVMTVIGSLNGAGIKQVGLISKAN